MTIITEPSPPEVVASNGLYSPPAELAPQTRARALDINAISQAVAGAFNKLPSEDVQKKGAATFAINSGSSGTAYLASRPGITSYTDGMEVVLRAGIENTGPATLNVNGLGAIAMKRADGELAQAKDIQAHAVLSLRYSQALNAFILPPVVGSQIALAQQAVVDAQQKVVDAATQVTLASNQVTLAANQVTIASGHASTASTKASEAAGSASAASTSADNASGSAAAASGSATLASNWAQLVGAAVTAGSYSAREWAVGTFTRGSAGGGSAKDWAQHTGSTVDGTNYSAKHWAAQAQAAIASAGFPVIVPATDAFKLMRVNAAGNAYELALPSIQGTTRTSNTALAALDSGKFIDITSGTFTQTFAACAALGAGWMVYLRNSGSGDITLDPNGSETIDGLASFIMYPGECRLIKCDGAALTSVVLAPFSKTFTSTANFVKPPGYTYFGGLLWGAGGSGARWPNMSGSMLCLGGAGGGCSEFKFPASKFGATETVVIGAGGAAVSAGGPGIAGGESSIGTLVKAGGGGGGIQAPDATVHTSYGQSYGASIAGLNNFMNGGYDVIFDSVYGGGSGARFYNSLPGTAGLSIFAGQGGAASDTGVASAGVEPAGGGGATRSGTSGAGARGEVRIWGIA